MKYIVNWLIDDTFEYSTSSDHQLSYDWNAVFCTIFFFMSFLIITYTKYSMVINEKVVYTYIAHTS